MHFFKPSVALHTPRGVAFFFFLFSFPLFSPPFFWGGGGVLYVMPMLIGAFAIRSHARFDRLASPGRTSNPTCTDFHEFSFRCPDDSTFPALANETTAVLHTCSTLGHANVIKMFAVFHFIS